MKSFRKLSRQIDQWYRDSSLVTHSQAHLNSALKRVSTQAEQCRQYLRTHQPIQRLQHLDREQVTAIVTSLKSRRRKSPKGRLSNSVILASAVLALTSAMGYRFYNEPQLAVGSIAPQTQRAPRDAVVEDTKTTEENREAARTGAIPILMIDGSVNQRIYQSFQRLIERGEELRVQAGNFPFVDPSALSTPTQRYLRQIEEWEWRTVLAAAESNQTVSSSDRPSSAAAFQGGPVVASKELTIIELRNYRRSHSDEEWQTLKNSIARARQRYSSARQVLNSELFAQPDNVQVYNTMLLDLTDEDWSQTKILVREALERILAQGIPQGLPSGILEEAVRVQLWNTPGGTEPLATAMLMNVLRPNLIKDPEQTKLRAEQAAEAVQPEMISIRRGEIIVQAGEEIQQADFVLLDYFDMSRRSINVGALLGFAGIVSGSIAIFWVAERIFHPGLRLRDHVLILLLVLSVPLVAIVNVEFASLPAIGILVGSFYGSPLGVTTIALLSIVLPIGMDVAWSALAASSVSGLVGAALAGRLRSREELALLGVGVGITQGIVYLIISLILAGPSSPVWYAVITAASIQALMGIAWSVVALGLSPYLENFFDLVTPTRLAELSNPNRPLLKRLASEAPGTFQHTLFVATLAEAAARVVGNCNVELVRTGTLYHDVGKMHDALGFIENQMGGPNKHDEIADPWKSAAIIKRHVSEGLVMARKCRLPKAVQAFIPEHQGTMLISYFYYQAVQQAKEDDTLQVNEADFRYDGPIPQSRETGIVMLADSCEAALRSLKDATPEEALAMVNRILRARWQDNQLIDSGLSREEMSCIAEIFVQVWLQFNHQRIPYPKGALNPVGQPSTAKA
jgi:putative nucleotidyltransferase with HDIG domain